VRILDRGTIFDATAAPPERRFCTVPSLVRLPGGRLVAALRAGSSKDAADEDTPVLVSDDNAATWRLVSNLAKTRHEDGGVQFIFLDQQLQGVLLDWAETAGVSDKRIANVVAVMRHVPHHNDHIHVRFKCRERDSSCR